MKRLMILLALFGCTSDPTKVTVKLTEYMRETTVSLDRVSSDEMATPPSDVPEDCAAVVVAACEAVMPGAVRIGTAYLVQHTPDGEAVEWRKCPNVLCVKTTLPAEKLPDAAVRVE